MASGVRQRRQRKVDDDDDDDDEGTLIELIADELEFDILETRGLGSSSLKWMVEGARPADRFVDRFRW